MSKTMAIHPAVDQGADTYSVPVITDYGSPPNTAPTTTISVLTAFQFAPRPGPAGAAATRRGRCGCRGRARTG